MKYIRIKVKHLLIIIIAVLLLSISLIHLQPYVLYLIGGAMKLTGFHEQAGAYYNRIAEKHESSLITIQAAKRRLEIILEQEHLSYFNKTMLIGSSWFSAGQKISIYSLNEINRQYESLKESRQANDTMAKYEMCVALMNFFGGYGDKALEILTGIDYIKNDKVYALWVLHTSAVYIQLGHMDNALSLLESMGHDLGEYGIIRDDLVKYASFMMQDYTVLEAIETDLAERQRYYNNHNTPYVKPFEEVRNSIQGFIEFIKNDKENRITGNTLTGRVMVNDTPLPYCLVFLQKAQNMNSFSSPMGLHAGVVKLVPSDEHGYFHISNIPNGMYAIGVADVMQRIGDKSLLMNRNYDIRFTGSESHNEDIVFFDTGDCVWANRLDDGNIEFDGQLPVHADYYTLTLGEVNTGNRKEPNLRISYYTDRFDELPFILDTESCRKNSFNIGMNMSSGGIDPYGFIEPLCHSGEYAYTLEAFDKNGDNVFRSNGVMSNRKYETVYIKGKEWSKADLLLLDGQYEEAIPEYEKDIHNGENVLHSAKVLAKLYYNGWNFNEKECRLEGSDYEKASIYLDIIDNMIYNSSVKETLANIYTRKKDYLQALHYYQQAAEENPYVNHRLGRLYGYMGQPDKAVEYYNKYYQLTGNGADYLMMLYLLQDNTEKLLETAPLHHNKHYYAEYERVVRDYLSVERSGYGDFYECIRANNLEGASELIRDDNSDIALLYKGIIILVSHIQDYEEKELEYSACYEQVEHESIKELMKFFGKAAINTGFGS